MQTLRKNTRKFSLANRKKELSEEYPQLEKAKITLLAKKNIEVFSDSEVGYQYGYGTKSYWYKIGFRTGRPFDKSELPVPSQQLIVELIKMMIPKTHKIFA